MDQYKTYMRWHVSPPPILRQFVRGNLQLRYIQHILNDEILLKW